jgi:hypothetical protein
VFAALILLGMVAAFLGPVIAAEVVMFPTNYDRKRRLIGTAWIDGPRPPGAGSCASAWGGA